MINTALVILQRKGYRVREGQQARSWYAEKDGWDFAADDPIQLLGAVSIYEFHHPTEYRNFWWRIDEPQLYNEVPKQAPEYVPVWRPDSRPKD